MRIAFLGYINSFDFYHIGGTDSIVRRLASNLAETGDHVTFVHYGCDIFERVKVNDRIEILRFPTFQQSLQALDGQYDHVVSIYLKAIDRLIYAKFRRTQLKGTLFHHFYMDWRPSIFKRKIFFSEARIAPFNGRLFCISPRIYRAVSKWSKRAVLLLPPVPESFFCKPEEKPDDGILRISYVGRIDPQKGTNEAIEIMNRFRDKDNVETCVSGFPWSHKKDTLELHTKLLTDHGAIYHPTDYKTWSPEVDSNLIKLLHRTDILLLPYRKLNSTVDTPLLLLEGMAALCSVITPSMGDLHDTYGNSMFNLTTWNCNEVIDMIEKNRTNLPVERLRLVGHNSSLSFDEDNITTKFRSCLLGNC